MFSGLFKKERDLTERERERKIFKRERERDKFKKEKDLAVRQRCERTQ